ncbi:LptF/LptG family permease, partial [Tolypothrix campylonemoides VB511288]
MTQRPVPAIRHVAAVALALLGALLPPAIARAASPAVKTDHLQSRLVAETTAALPGTTLTLGLLLEHDPDWHTYWRNAGDSGLPTEIALTLPDGVVAGAIEWPHPQRFELSGIVNFGYGGRRLLPVAITIPDGYAAATLPIRAAANWLICEVECIPGKAEYAFELPVATTADVDARWAADFAAARADQPRAAAGTLAVAEDGDAIALTLTGAGAAPTGSTWFPETAALVANGATPTWTRDGDAWRTRWPKSEYFTAMPGDIAFVAVDGDGAAWRFAARASAAVPATAAAGTGTAPGGGDTALGRLPALLFAFLGGLVLNLMPCVFPVLSIKAMGALGSADDRAALRRHGAWYALGIVATFLLLAGVLLALRAGGQQLGWGFQLQEPRFVAAIALLLFAMALSFSGVWEFTGRFMGAGQRLTEGHGARASFFTGALAVVVASPCTAPFMGTALGWALAQPAVAALSVFAALGLGLAAPMLLLGVVPALARALPRPGPWLEGFRQLLAFPLYLTVVWLLWVYGEQTSPLGMAWLLAALTALAFALWLLGRRPAMRSNGARAVAAFASVGVVAVAVINPMAAALNARFELTRAELMANYLGDQPKDIWLRQGDDNSQIVIHAKARDARQGAVTLRGVSLFIYEKNANGTPEFRRRLEATEATLMPGFWRLRDVREATAGDSSIRSDTLTIRSTLDAEAAMESLASPEAIAFWRLPKAIQLTEQAGFSASGYRLRFHQLLAMPLLFAAMAILAAAFSLRLTRLGGLAGLAGAGVALGFVLFFF